MGRATRHSVRRGRAKITGNEPELSSSDKVGTRNASRKTAANSAEQSSKKKVSKPHRSHSSEETLLKCDQCDKTFTRNSTLFEHKRIHSGAKPYECDKCDKTFARKFTLNQHKITHRRGRREKPFRCRKCRKGFTQKGNLDRHVKLHGAGTKSQHSQSGKASAKNVNFADFTSHIKVPPGKGGTLTCVTRVSLHGGKLVGHQQIHNADKSITSLPSIEYKDQKPVKCEKEDLTVHETTHTEEKPYLCNKCDEAFPLKKDLNWHFGTKHRSSEKKLFRKQLAEKYLVTRSADKVYQCGVCKKKFTNKFALKLHGRKHIGEKPFQCGKCGKVFKLYVDLKNHLRTHN